MKKLVVMMIVMMIVRKTKKNKKKPLWEKNRLMLNKVVTMEVYAVKKTFLTVHFYRIVKKQLFLQTI